jgi:hypothetical protein
MTRCLGRSGPARPATCRRAWPTEGRHCHNTGGARSAQAGRAVAVPRGRAQAVRVIREAVATSCPTLPTGCSAVTTCSSAATTGCWAAMTGLLISRCATAMVGRVQQPFRSPVTKVTTPGSLLAALCRVARTGPAAAAPRRRTATPGHRTATPSGAEVAASRAAARERVVAAGHAGAFAPSCSPRSSRRSSSPAALST